MGKPRARDLEIPFDGTPAPLNSITDVAGIEVRMTTLIAELRVAGVPVGRGRLREVMRKYNRFTLRGARARAVM